MTETEVAGDGCPHSPDSKYLYWQEAFSRNLGFITPAEQERIHNATIALPGLGGVGGLHLVTLARLGVARFHLADFDRFETANINRQLGARLGTFGRPKLDVMAEDVRAINPFVRVSRFPEGICPENLDRFLEGVDVVVDGLDFFNFEIRRLLFTRARQRGVHVVTAGPIGFGSALLVFAPDQGMSFDRYFNIRENMSTEEKLIAFFVGLAPKAAQKRYTLPGSISMAEQRGPSLSAGCQMSAAAAAAEVVRILLKKPGLRPVPNYVQYDPFVRKFHQGRLWLGNRGPLQAIKQRMLKAKVGAAADFIQEPPPPSPGLGLRPTPNGDLDPSIRDYILRAAIRAPSGDNCQPWQFTAGGRRIVIRLNPAADASFFNYRQTASLISLGAAAENLSIAASRFGLEASVHIPRHDSVDRIEVDLQTAHKAEDPLQRFIWHRHTNRTLYDRSALDPAAVHRLCEAAALFPDSRLLLLTAPDRIREAARLVFMADRIRAGHRGLHRHLMRMIRFNRCHALETRDGFPLKNLEAGTAGEWFLRCSRPWPVMAVLNSVGMGNLIALISYRGVRSASAVGLLKVKSGDPIQLIRGGRALQRIWLTAACLGIDFQPMTALTLFWQRWQQGARQTFASSHRRLLNRVWPQYRSLFDVRNDGEGHVMLFRLGRGRPVGSKTLRKPLESFLVLPDTSSAARPVQSS